MLLDYYPTPLQPLSDDNTGNVASRKLLLGVTGGIAAYKSPDLVRRLREHGFDVQVVMSEGAKTFITEMSLQAVSGSPVRSALFDSAAEAAMGHIELARWPDAILIAPATAECLAKLVQGRADDLLTTLCLATDKPIYLAPAMNRLMWSNEATQANVKILQERGYVLLGPGEGEQACGEVGAGRMLEPVEIANQLSLSTSGTIKPLLGKHVLVTAGPTVEPLDPVRYLSNHSSGKMGYAVATAAAATGAEVTLISGPTALQCPNNVKRINVQTAAEMLAACQAESAMQPADVFIATAAVADYQPVEVATQKIKKKTEELTITLRKNPDILATIAADHPQTYCVGFAAETDNVIDYAREKLQRKRLQMVAANDVSNGQVFGRDDNQLTLVWQDGSATLAPSSKLQQAHELIHRISLQLK